MTLSIRQFSELSVNDRAIEAAEAAIARVAKADKEAEATGRAVLLGPERLVEHVKATNEYRLKELYRELGYPDQNGTAGPQPAG